MSTPYRWLLLAALLAVLALAWVNYSEAQTGGGARYKYEKRLVYDLHLPERHSG
jgi:hypothetical protein